MIGLLVLSLLGMSIASPVAHPAARTSHPVTPLITAAPTHATMGLSERDGMITVAVSSCENYSDPDDNIDDVCQCSGYGGFIPAMTGGNCNYTAITTFTTPTNPYPFTFTSANSAIIAYETTTAYFSGPGFGVGASSIIQAGQSLTVQINPTASQEIGVLGGEALYTSVSNALVTACGTPSAGATITTCADVTITSVAYGAGSTILPDGQLEVTVPEVSVYDPNTLDALIAAVAGAFRASSQIQSNIAVTSLWPDQLCGGMTDACTQGPSDYNITTVNSIAQAIYTNETTAAIMPLQNLQAVLAFNPPENEASCSKEALAMDSMGAIGAFLGVIGDIPGFEWIEFEAVFLDVLNMGLAGSAEAVSIACEVTEAESGA